MNPASSQLDPQEEKRAEALAAYLEAVDNGQAFAVPEEFNDPELVELAKLAREFTTTFQPATLEEDLLEEAPQSRFRLLWAWITIPVAAAAVVVVSLAVQNGGLQTPATQTLFSTPTEEQVAELDATLADFDALDDLDATLADFDATIEEMEALLDDDAFADIDTALAAANL